MSYIAIYLHIKKYINMQNTHHSLLVLAVHVAMNLPQEHYAIFLHTFEHNNLRNLLDLAILPPSQLLEICSNLATDLDDVPDNYKSVKDEDLPLIHFAESPLGNLLYHIFSSVHS